MGKELKEIITIEEKKAQHGHQKKQEESIYDLLGAGQENKICFTTSMEEVLLKLIYEILLVKAQKSGKNQILIPSTLESHTKNLLQKSEDIGLKVVEINVNSKGIIDKKAFEESVSERSLAFICPFVNLTGSINEVFELAKICKQKEIFSFCDASMACGKVLFRFKDLSLDMVSCSNEKVVAFALKNKSTMMSLTKYSYPDNDDLLSFFSWAKDLLQKMDTDPYECACIKNEIIEQYSGMNGCQFLSSESSFLFDQLMFGFSGIEAENLAFYLRQEGILVQYLEVKEALEQQGLEKSVASTFVMMKFNSENKGRKVQSDFKKIIALSKKNWGDKCYLKRVKITICGTFIAEL